MGDVVVSSIGRGEIEYYAALRADQVSKTLSKKRPELAAKFGGEEGVRSRLLEKARDRKGVTRDLENIRRDAADTELVPDDVLRTYLEQPKVTLSEARSVAHSLEERRAVEGIVKDVRRLNSQLRAFRGVDLTAAPNLGDLRRALASLIDTAQELESDIINATLSAP